MTQPRNYVHHEQGTYVPNAADRQAAALERIANALEELLKPRIAMLTPCTVCGELHSHRCDAPGIDG